MSESDSLDWLPALLVAQGALAAIDAYGNRPRAAREALNALLFLAFAWLAWLGAFSWAIAVLLVAQALVAIQMNGGRLMALQHLNLGAIIALFVPLLRDWGANPNELAPAHHGWMSWALTALGVAAAAWAVRGAAAKRR